MSPYALDAIPFLFRGLLYCMEYLEENLDEWLGEELEVSSYGNAHCLTVLMLLNCSVPQCFRLNAMLHMPHAGMYASNCFTSSGVHSVS